MTIFILKRPQEETSRADKASDENILRHAEEYPGEYHVRYLRRLRQPRVPRLQRVRGWDNGKMEATIL